MKLRRAEKLRRYRVALKKLDHVADGLGMPIDPGIKKTVALLNVLGHPTQQSCEGHLNPRSGDIMPWVHLEAETKNKEMKVRRLIRTYWRRRGARPSIADAFRITMRDIFDHRNAKKLAVLRIEPGDDFVDWKRGKGAIPLSARKWLLAEGRREIDVFTAYLWGLYFGGKNRGKTLD